jgi:1-acyl-sn-glycerol-3-phosphate acyltransferase
VFLFLYFVVANIELRLLFLKHGKPESLTTRDPFYAWTMKWGLRLFRTFTTIMRVKVTIDPESVPCTEPCIIIANHRSEFDVFMLPAMIAILGVKRMRGIVKREVGTKAVFGPAVRSTGCALVSRGKDPHDAERVKRCALGARDDGATVALFPEGTLYGNPAVHTPGKERYREVLPPRYGGVKILRDALPEYPVVSVTIDWNGIPAGTSMSGLHCLYRGHLHLSARKVEIADGEDVPTWLEREWRRKDAYLSRESAH